MVKTFKIIHLYKPALLRDTVCIVMRSNEIRGFKVMVPGWELYGLCSENALIFNLFTPSLHEENLNINTLILLARCCMLFRWLLWNMNTLLIMHIKGNLINDLWITIIYICKKYIQFPNVMRTVYLVLQYTHTLKILWSLQLSYLQIQAITGSYVVWSFSRQSLDHSSHTDFNSSVYQIKI